MSEVEMLREHLALAQSHIAQGEEHIRKQHRIIAELEDHGHDTRKARDFLKELEDVQTMHAADRDRIVEEIEREVGRHPTST